MAQLSAGGFFACGLTGGQGNGSGAAVCWGQGDVGTLAQSNWASSAEPVVANGGKLFTQLSAGGYHVCGVETGTSQVMACMLWPSEMAKYGGAAADFPVL